MYKNILLPTDGSEISLEAVEYAVALAGLCHAFLHIVYVRGSYPYANIDAAHSAGREDYEAAAASYGCCSAVWRRRCWRWPICRY